MRTALEADPDRDERDTVPLNLWKVLLVMRKKRDERDTVPVTSL